MRDEVFPSVSVSHPLSGAGGRARFQWCASSLAVGPLRARINQVESLVKVVPWLGDGPLFMLLGVELADFTPALLVRALNRREREASVYTVQGSRAAEKRRYCIVMCVDCRP